MSRPAGTVNKNTFEFAQKFDELSKTHGDPLVLMFKISGASSGIGRGWDKSHRLEATKQLLSYRYPKLKAVEARIEALETQIEIKWLDNTENGSNDPLPAAQVTAKAS